MREPRWVERVVVDAIHLDTLREHGGLGGRRDENARESALARPRQRWEYEPASDLEALAAAYGFGICRNHPYRDGNKRVAFVVMAVFLELNGTRFAAAEHEVVSVMVELAADGVTEAELADWLRAHTSRRKRRR